MKLGKYVERIIGHPGTGKTTKLATIFLELVEKKGLDFALEHVLGANFSRSSSFAMREKLKEKDIPLKETKNIGTIHSLSAKLLDLKEKKVFVQPEEAEGFLDHYHIPYEKHITTIDDIEMFGYVGELDINEDGNAILSYFQYLKKILIEEKKIRRAIWAHEYLPVSMKDILSHYSGEILFDIYDGWEEWKRENGKYEYEDMLQEIYERELPFFNEIHYGLIDEAQDLSPLQFRVLEVWLRDAEQVYLAGDELQTLYFFNGAHPSLLRNIEKDKENILSQSYRVPRIPWEEAQRIAHLNQCFTVDQVKPASNEGDVIFINIKMVKDIIRDPKGGKYFVLFRNNQSAFSFLQECINDGLIPHGLGRIVTQAKEEFFILRYELLFNLYHDLPLSYDQVRSIIIRIPAEYLKRGVKTAFRNRKRTFWHDKGLSEVDTHALFFSLFKNVHSIERLKEILSDPRVSLGKGRSGYFKKRVLLNMSPLSLSLREVKAYVGTYHASKGLECDNAILFDFLAPRSSSLYEERCLTFTGMTRTRNIDYIVPASGYSGMIETDIKG